MAITASLVKELRERTGAGMMDCKKALAETDGDLEAAIDLMRASGQAKAAKKAGRIAAEGLVKTALSSDGKTATIIEVNCETDFVSKGDDFVNFVDELSQIALDIKANSVEELNTQTMANGKTVETSRVDLIAKIGENMNIRRIRTISIADGLIASYIHGGGRIGVLVAISDNADLGKSIAMHICASKPESLDEDSLDPELIEREKAIFIEQARESGKPEEIIEKMITGRMKKFVAEVTLSGQNYIMDTDKTVAQVLSENNAKISEFVRYEVGEGIEKAEDNFVEEVMAQVKN
jgi:elongation factor Ts